jgi:hypothetical protein
MSGAVNSSPKIIPWWQCLVDSPSKIEPPEWLPFHHALQQRRDRVGSGRLAARDLLTWLSDGQLPSAIRLINSKSQQTNALLLAKFWRQGALSGVNDDADFTRVHFRDPSFDGDGYIFVRADVFGRLNASAPPPPPDKEPTSTSAPPSEPSQEPASISAPLPAPPSEEPNRTLRRRSTKHPWNEICGEIARLCIDPKTRRVRVPRNEAKLAEEVLLFCQNTLKCDPPVSDMREAVAAVCAALRKI